MLQEMQTGGKLKSGSDMPPMYVPGASAAYDNQAQRNYEKMTGQPTIWLTMNDCLTVTIDGSKRTNDIVL